MVELSLSNSKVLCQYVFVDAGGAKSCISRRLAFHVLSLCS